MCLLLTYVNISIIRDYSMVISCTINVTIGRTGHYHVVISKILIPNLLIIVLLLIICLY